MKIVTSLLNQEDVTTAVRRLTQNQFSYDDLSIVSSSADIPAYLEGDPEESAATGAILGAVTGGAAGAVSTVIAASVIPGYSMLYASGLLTTALGSVVGGYLGSLYNVRDDSEVEMTAGDAVAAGQILLVVQCTDEAEAETAVALLEETNAEHIDTQTIPDEEVENNP